MSEPHPSVPGAPSHNYPPYYVMFLLFSYPVTFGGQCDLPDMPRHSFFLEG